RHCRSPRPAAARRLPRLRPLRWRPRSKGGPRGAFAFWLARRVRVYCAAAMKIAEFLREDLILPDLQATDKPAVLRELCIPLGRVFGLDAGRLTEVLLEREKLGSTGVGEGVAIPPGKLPGVPNRVAAFGRSQTRVAFTG